MNPPTEVLKRNLDHLYITKDLLDHYLSDISNSPDPPSTCLSNGLFRWIQKPSSSVLLISSTDVFRVSWYQDFLEIIETYLEPEFTPSCVDHALLFPFSILRYWFLWRMFFGSLDPKFFRIS